MMTRRQDGLHWKVVLLPGKSCSFFPQDAHILHSNGKNCRRLAATCSYQRFRTKVSLALSWNLAFHNSATPIRANLASILARKNIQRVRTSTKRDSLMSETAKLSQLRVVEPWKTICWFVREAFWTIKYNANKVDNKPVKLYLWRLLFDIIFMSQQFPSSFESLVARLGRKKIRTKWSVVNM